MSIHSKGLTVLITDTLIDTAQTSRSYVGIQNLDASNPVHITFGGQASTASNGVRIGAGEFFDTNAPFNGTEIRGIAITGSVNIVLMTD